MRAIVARRYKARVLPHAGTGAIEGASAAPPSAGWNGSVWTGAGGGRGAFPQQQRRRL